MEEEKIGIELDSRFPIIHSSKRNSSNVHDALKIQFELIVYTFNHPSMARLMGMDGHGKKQLQLKSIFEEFKHVLYLYPKRDFHSLLVD